MVRADLSRVKSLVVKVGTGTLADRSGCFDRENCERLAAELAEAGRGRRLVLVTSGSITLGAQRLGLVRSRARPWDMATKQACAAVGQPDLVAAWGAALAPHHLPAAQVLLTAEDLASRKRFLNARRTFSRLHDLGVLAVVNENDTVAVEEIKVGDNDSLAALVATCVEAELLVLLTDVEGLYDRDPAAAGARLLGEVPRVTAEVERLAGGAGSERSVGGMVTKLRAAKRLAAQGAATALVSGRRPGALRDLLAGAPVGTFFPRSWSGSAEERAGSPPRPAGGGPSWSTRGRGRRCARVGAACSPPGSARWRGSSGWATRWTSQWRRGGPSRAASPVTGPTRCAASRASSRARSSGRSAISTSTRWCTGTTSCCSRSEAAAVETGVTPRPGPPATVREPVAAKRIHGR